MRWGWQEATSQLKNSSIQQNRSPLKPHAQQPSRSTQFRLQHNFFCTLQRLYLTLQWRMACPGLGTHALAGLCALGLARGNSTVAKQLQYSAKPQPPSSQSTCCPTGSQHPVQAPAHLPCTAEAAFDLVVAHGMSRAGYSHTGRALCAVVGEHHLHSCKTPAFSKTAAPSNHLPSPPTAPSAGPSTPALHCRGCI